MQQPEEKDHRECMNRIIPIKDALDVLSGKWKLPILVALMLGDRRFGELSKSIPKMTDRMLSKELRDLEMNGLVKRTVHDTVPVTVVYSITAYGRTIRPVIEALDAWGTQHRSHVKALAAETAD